MPPYPYHPHGHEAVGRRFEQDFLSFEVYEDPVEVVDEDAQEVYGSGDWHNADEEEEYVNDGRRGSYEVASDNYREEEEYDHPQAYLFPHDSHADSRYIQTSVSPEQSSYSDSHTLTRYGEPYFHEYDQHQSGPDGQYLPSSSPDCYPFSGTLCEPTSSPPVQTSDTIIEPDSPRSEEWSSPPAYKLKRKADGLDEPEDDELYFEASREEKRSRLESASHVPYSAVHPHLGTYEPAGTIQNQSASATPPVSYQQQALDHPSRSAAPSPSSTPTPPATQNRKRRHEPVSWTDQLLSNTADRSERQRDRRTDAEEAFPCSCPQGRLGQSASSTLRLASASAEGESSLERETALIPQRSNRSTSASLAGEPGPAPFESRCSSLLRLDQGRARVCQTSRKESVQTASPPTSRPKARH